MTSTFFGEAVLKSQTNRIFFNEDGTKVAGDLKI